MKIKNVALVGANGHLGPSMLQALLESKAFSVTIISRKSSKSSYGPEVKVVSVGDDLPHDDLVQALQAQDALVITFSGNNSDQARKLIDAAIEAGVQLVVPPDFGSCDSSDSRTLDLIPLYGRKAQLRAYLQNCEDKISWISIVSGHFFDYGLTSGLMAVDVPQRKIRIFDGGDIAFSATTMPSIGLAAAQALQHADELKNKLIYVQSVSMTQNELKQALETVTGSEFKAEHVSSSDWIAKQKAILSEKEKDHDATEELVTVGGTIYADWTGQAMFVNDLLGMPKEELVELLRRLDVK